MVFPLILVALAGLGMTKLSLSAIEQEQARLAEESELTNEQKDEARQAIRDIMRAKKKPKWLKVNANDVVFRVWGENDEIEYWTWPESELNNNKEIKEVNELNDDQNEEEMNGIKDKNDEEEQEKDMDEKIIEDENEGSIWTHIKDFFTADSDSENENEKYEYDVNEQDGLNGNIKEVTIRENYIKLGKNERNEENNTMEDNEGDNNMMIDDDKREVEDTGMNKDSKEENNNLTNQIKKESLIIEEDEEDDEDDEDDEDVHPMTGEVLKKKLEDHLERKDDEEDDNLCCICFDNDRDSVFMSCGHGGVCFTCAVDIYRIHTHCPLCREGINQILMVDELVQQEDGSFLAKVVGP